MALAAGAIALLALAAAIFLFIRFRRLQEAHTVVLGPHEERDLVGHAQTLQMGFDELHGHVQRTFEELERRIELGEGRLDNAISRSSVVRYDAYNEMSGRQSSSIALLDDTGTGIVMSSILHRDQARLYIKGVQQGESDLELSPEEVEAIRNASRARTRL